MKKLSFLSFLLLCSSIPVKGNVNGGKTCAGCVILIGLADHLAQVHSTDIATAINHFLCEKIKSGLLKDVCKILSKEFTPILVDKMYHGYTPDMICHSIGMCRQDPGKDYCHIFPLPKSSNLTRPVPSFETAVLSARHKVHIPFNGTTIESALCSIPGMKEICAALNGFVYNHVPLQDHDKDKFSTIQTLRGSYWKGKDCNDKRKDVYPGRKPIDHDIEFDSNCNGIYGVDPKTGRPFEEMYCSGTSHKGIAILGDSVGAHFHIPPEYLMAARYNKDTFKDLLTLLRDEIDWPQLSFITAFSTTNEWPHSINGPIDSLYLRMLEQNKCIHRDYQNIAVNNGTSSNMHGIMKGLSRNQTMDYPMIVVLALFGNDVCNEKYDTLASMTTPEEYKNNMIVTLNYLNETLPIGSTVIISGLADGRVLWDTLSQRIHPLGKLNNDVTYQNFYDYLNCLELSPCKGWLNSNFTLRDLTSKRAAELSSVGQALTQTLNYTNFNMVYVNFDTKRIMKEWEAQGGEAWELIEPVDGFHPSQVGQYLISKFLYQLLSTNYTEIWGSKNPHNQAISEAFGTQGGY